MTLAKPAVLHDRDQQWATLAEFATSPSPGTQLALEQAQLVERVDDAFRQRRPVYRIAEPVLRLHQLLIAPNEADLVGGGGERVWQDSADTVRSKIYGPHLEELARQWCLRHAGADTLGGRASAVRSATLACAVHRRNHELDAVVIQRRPGESDEVLAIGEAKSTQDAVGEGELDRLEHLRGLIPPNRLDGPPRLLLFSRSGFTPRLVDRSRGRQDVELIDMERLYAGD